MDRTTITDENLKRRALWNRSDLKVYAQPESINSTTTLKKKQAREEIERATKLFLARGGKIEHLPDGDTGYQPGAKAFIISARNNSNAL